MNWEINPYVRRCWNHNWPKDLVMERVIYDHEIIYIDKGQMNFTIKGQKYEATEGCCIILPPNVFHKIEGVAEETHQPHVHFDFVELENSEEIPVLVQNKKTFTAVEKNYFRENFFIKNNVDIPYVIKLQQPEKVRKLMFEILETFTHQKQYNTLALKGLIINLVVAILDDYHISSSNDAKEQEVIHSLVSHMYENINHNFKLKEMADFANMTVWNLIQQFNKMYGITPKKYFEKYRLLHAKTLLEIEKMPVKEIAYLMEFDSPQTFTRWFKNLDGKNPNSYKSSNK